MLAQELLDVGLPMLERMIQDVAVLCRGKDDGMALCHAEEKTKQLQSRNSLASFIFAASWFTHTTHVSQ
ncbi:hypothetical protein PS2_018608 [Malus domestica]